MESMANTDYNDDITYAEYQPDGGPILYPVPSYWIEVEGIFPTIVGGTTFYPHLMYYVPVFGYETPYDTVDYEYSPSADLVQYENDNMMYEQDSTEYYSAQSDEDFPPLATDTYHTSEVPDFDLEPEASNVGAEDLQRSDADSSFSTIDSYQTEDRDSELCSAGTVSSVLKRSYKQIEYNDFDSKNVNNSLTESLESSLNSSYGSNDKWFACKDSESICKEMSSDDIILEDENNWAKKKSDHSSNCTYASSKIKDNFVAQSSKCIYGKLSDEDVIVSHNDNIFEKQELKDPLDNSESCYQSEFLASENSENACDQLTSEDTISSNISNTDLQKNNVTSFVFAETKLKHDAISNHGIKHCSGDSVKKNDIKKYRTRSSSECKSSNDSGEINYEYERVFMKGFEFDCESKTWEYQRMKKFNSLGDLSNTQSIKEYNTLEDLSKTRSLRKKEDSSRSDDDENFEVELLESDVDYASIETKAENDEYGEKNCLSVPDCIELTDEEVKYMKDGLYLTALSGKLYKKTQIPPVEVLPIIYEEGEESLCEDDDESRTLYEEIEEELSEDNDESSTIYEEVVEQLCEGNEETSELQTSAVSEGEGDLTGSPDLSKSVKQQKSKGKRMKNIRKFFSRLFCCVKPP